MIAAILGVLISTMFLPQYSLTWAVTVGIISFVMLIASMVSMTKAPVEDELALDEGSVRYVKAQQEDLTFFGRRTNLMHPVFSKKRK